MAANLPIVNAGLMYATNLQTARTSNTTLSIAAGAARDSTNTNDIILSEGVTLNAATIGANGIDTGALAANTWYAVHLIGSSGNLAPPATLLSTSATAPALPANYDIFRRIRWMRTNNSTQFFILNSYGNGNLIYYFWDTLPNVLTGAGSATYAAVNCVSGVAPTSNILMLNWFFVPSANDNGASLRPTGSSATNNIAVTGGVASRTCSGTVRMNCNNSQSIDYATASASDQLSLNVVGFEDFI